MFSSFNRFYQKTKETKRCSVKSSTMYKKHFILIVYFLLSKNQNSVRPVFAVARKSFFSTQKRNFFFLFSFFYHLIRVIKSEICYKMQREKLYYLHSKAYCNNFQKTRNAVLPIFARSKFGRSKFCPFSKQKVRLKKGGLM